MLKRMISGPVPITVTWRIAGWCILLLLFLIPSLIACSGPASTLSPTPAPVPAPIQAANQPPVISSLTAVQTLVYPASGTEIWCVASDSTDDQLNYRWSCTGGSFNGSGSNVTWEAPNQYGDYHIMVIVEDGKGGSIQGTLSLSVVPRPAQPSRRSCCN